MNRTYRLKLEMSNMIWFWYWVSEVSKGLFASHAPIRFNTLQSIVHVTYTMDWNDWSMLGYCDANKPKVNDLLCFYILSATFTYSRNKSREYRDSILIVYDCVIVYDFRIASRRVACVCVYVIPGFLRIIFFESSKIMEWYIAWTIERSSFVYKVFYYYLYMYVDISIWMYTYIDV